MHYEEENFWSISAMCWYNSGDRRVFELHSIIYTKWTQSPMIEFSVGPLWMITRQLCAEWAINKILTWKPRIQCTHLTCSEISFQCTSKLCGLICSNWNFHKYFVFQNTTNFSINKLRKQLLKQFGLSKSI